MDSDSRFTQHGARVLAAEHKTEESADDAHGPSMIEDDGPMLVGAAKRTVPERAQPTALRAWFHSIMYAFP